MFDMQSCSSLSSSGICRSFTKRKPDSPRRTKLRLVGGRSVQLYTYHPTITSVSTMSSVSCPDSLGTANGKVAAKKRSGARRKRSGKKDSSVRDDNANIIFPACQTSNSECLYTDVLCTSVASWSLPNLQPSVDNTPVVFENLPVSNFSCITEQSEVAAEAPSGEITKQTGRRKYNRKTTGRTAVRKSKGSGTVAGAGKKTVVKRRRSTGTTVNDKFVRSMTMFVSEVAKSIVSACVEQTFAQLSQQGMLFSPFVASLSVDNGTVSSLDQHGIACQRISSLQPEVDSFVSPNHLFSSLPSGDFSLSAVQQQAQNDFFTLQSYISTTQSFSHSSDLLCSHIEQLAATDTATAGREIPVCCEYNTFSACSETVDTASYAAYDSVAQSTQLSNVADYALIDLLNMSDDALDVLLSGSVDRFSNNELPCAAACSAANSNGVFVSVDARTCHTDVPVCYSFVTSVTEAFDCCPLLLAAMDSPKMSELFGEETFQPDYFELDDESDRASVVTSSVSAHTSGECTTGKKISIKKPGVEKLTVSAETRRKRPWKSSSRNNTASSDASSSVEVTVVVSSSSNAQPAIIRAPSPACDQILLTAEEVLEGEG